MVLIAAALVADGESVLGAKWKLLERGYGDLVNRLSVLGRKWLGKSSEKPRSGETEKDGRDWRVGLLSYQL